MLAALILFVTLGLDTLAVSVGLGLSALPRTLWLRVGLTFALFEGLMPLVGLLAGQGLSASLGEWAGYLAAVLLIVVGLLAIREALSDEEDSEGVLRADDLSGKRLLLVGLSVSLDELAVGFSLGVLAVPVGLALVYIAAQAFALTFLGLALGGRLGERVGERAELASGVVLSLLGVALLVSQATGSHFL
ncbi:MAG: manganese efflux pump MntP family protein [Chloroflexota bacterium]|nr:manganese efflux pump MntP family protein [Chloroflexota bacterium]